MTVETFDLLGLGFGPAGISLAATIEDRTEGAGCKLPWKIRFFDKAERIVWQGELLLPKCNIRHHHFRDLATPRNPRSRFTFANYLKEKGRLFSFGLLHTGVSRIEWSDYVAWAAEQLAHHVQYGTEVTKIEPLVEDGRVSRLKLMTNRGEVHARNMVLASGQVPYIPDSFIPFMGHRCFHSSEFLTRMKDLDTGRKIHITLIGAGQSAAEAARYLHDVYRRSEIACIQRTIGFKQTDEGPFSQMAYLPEETDYYYSLSTQQRRHVTKDVRVTNYSVVDLDVCQDLYLTIYENQILNRSRIEIVRRHKTVEMSQNNGSYRLKLQDVHSGARKSLDTDMIVLCTGFREEPFPSLLKDLRPYIEVDSGQGVVVSRDYEVKTTDRFDPAIYLNGLTERTHGLSDSASFSMMALKAGRIFQSFCDSRRRADSEPASEARMHADAV